MYLKLCMYFQKISAWYDLWCLGWLTPTIPISEDDEPLFSKFKSPFGVGWQWPDLKSQQPKPTLCIVRDILSVKVLRISVLLFLLLRVVPIILSKQQLHGFEMFRSETASGLRIHREHRPGCNVENVETLSSHCLQHCWVLDKYGGSGQFMGT